MVHFRYYRNNEVFLIRLVWSRPCSDRCRTEPTCVPYSMQQQISSRSVDIWENGGRKPVFES